MTRHTPLWLQDGSYAATVDRRLISSLWPDGRTEGLAVSPQGGGMVINIGPGAAAIPAANGTGSVLCVSDAPEQLELAPPGVTGQDRIDVIVVDPRGDDIGNPGVQPDFLFQAISGPVGPAPTPPAIPDGTQPLARINVPGGSVTINANQITDLRPFDLSVPRGIRLPDPLGPADPFQSFLDGNGDVWVARGGVRGGNLTAVLMQFDTPTYDEFAMYETGANAGWRLPIAGIYRIRCMLGISTPDTAYRFFECQVRRFPSLEVVARGNNGSVGQAGQVLFATPDDMGPSQATDVLQTVYSGNASTGAGTFNGVVGQVSCYSEIAYLGRGPHD